MNQAESPKIDFSQLLRAVEGLTQWRPMALGFLTLVSTGLLTAIGQYLAIQLGGAAGAGLGLLIALIAIIVAAAGFQGVGVMLMDRAKSISPRSMLNALLYGLLCLPKAIGFFAALLGLTLLMTLLAALVYWVCKIPGVGPLLLFVAHPLLVVGAGVFFTAVFWVAIPLFMPAVWDGRGFKEAFSVMFAVARTRLVHVVALFLGLYAVVSVVALLLFAALLPGYAFMSGLAGSIIGPNMSGDMSSLMSIFGGGGASGHMYAGLFATALIFAVATTLMFQVFIMGINLVYLSVTAGLDISASQEALEAGLNKAKTKAREAQERAREAADRARQSARNAASAAQTKMEASAPSASIATVPSEPLPYSCPKCHGSITVDDAFCGHCGHKLH